MSKFHEDLETNLSSRLFTCSHYIHLKKTAQLPDGHVFSLIMTIFTLIRDIHITNAKHVTSRVKKTPPGGHVFLPIQTIIELNCPIQGGRGYNVGRGWEGDICGGGYNVGCEGGIMWEGGIMSGGMGLRGYNGGMMWEGGYNVVEVGGYNVGVGVRGGFMWVMGGGIMWDDSGRGETNVLTNFMKIEQTRKKNAPTLGSHVFQAKDTIFELIQDIIGTNHLSKFHEDQKINVASRVLTMKNAMPPGGHVFQPTAIIFELVQDIIGINLLTKFYEDRTINVASRVKNAPPLGSHVFQANGTIFELIQDIIETNLLTKFHEDWTINANIDVAQRTTYDGQKAITKAHQCSGELKIH
ncbi:hypothetical protein DPMN_153156 [Dreissena polymorpha]|uniref:Uncharacterized protein n=1 Tax=Dreissena polymorpha TaxID=45954 RepID=A0A9D4FK92_DREPO|nr:hypothetical protein DPMN_153156 [Dreissena polymorpha]